MYVISVYNIILLKWKPSFCRNLKVFSNAPAKEDIKPESPTVFIYIYLFEILYFLLKTFACKMGTLNSCRNHLESIPYFKWSIYLFLKNDFIHILLKNYMHVTQWSMHPNLLCGRNHGTEGRPSNSSGWGWAW